MPRPARARAFRKSPYQDTWVSLRQRSGVDRVSRMSGVFISYRRDDSGPRAGRLGDFLGRQFGPARIFMDVDDIPPGEDFLSVIRRNVTSSEACLVVIGPEWTTLTEPEGGLRLHAPRDVVRTEVRTALERGLTVIPVLVGGAKMPNADELPPDIRDLGRRQAVEIRDAKFAQDAQKLIDRLSELPAAREEQSRRLRKRLFAGVTLAALAAVAAWFLWVREPVQRSFAGEWKGSITYRYWGGKTLEETLRLTVAGERVTGTVSFLGIDRGIEDGRVDGREATFRTSFALIPEGRQVNAYRAVLAGEELRVEYSDESQGGAPIVFTARRAAR